MKFGSSSLNTSNLRRPLLGWRCGRLAQLHSPSHVENWRNKLAATAGGAAFEARLLSGARMGIRAKERKELLTALMPNDEWALLWA